MQQSGKAFFREEQRFRQRWLWLVNLGTAGIMWYGFVRQVVLGQPFGDRPASDVLLLLLWLAFGIGLPLFFHSLRLITVVDADGVHFRFVPFHFSGRVLPPAYICGYEARTYSPIREYGGWGIRSGRGGDAYNVRGDKGIQFVLEGGKKILIGTQQPEKFLAAIDKIFAGASTPTKQG